MKSQRPLTGHDPLYGSFRLPAFLEPFLASPEFERLAGVRLLNCDSVELAALSEARRRSHTLGVLHLATRMPLLEFGDEDVRALLYAIVLHDVGTPPFGHTMEYEFIRLLHTDHEEFVGKILDADHHTHGDAHQLGGRPIALRDLIRKTGVEDRIRSILSGGHPLSTALAGDLDVDNVDNVFRVAWYLGLRPDPTVAERLVGAIGIDHRGVKLLAVEHRPLVEEWARLREAGYRVLFDSPRHRQAQAVLSALIARAFLAGDDGRPFLARDDWLMTDEQLLTGLRGQSSLAPIVADLDRRTLLPETTVEFETDERLSRRDLMEHRHALAASLHEFHDLLYVTFIPYGETLHRRVTFVDPLTGGSWSVGSPKRSYRLHIHYGGSGERGLEALRKRVLGTISGHASDAGWRIRSGSCASTA